MYSIHLGVPPNPEYSSEICVSNLYSLSTCTYSSTKVHTSNCQSHAFDLIRYRMGGCVGGGGGGGGGEVVCGRQRQLAGTF